jgi:hypothetical protein
MDRRLPTKELTFRPFGRNGHFALTVIFDEVSSVEDAARTGSEVHGLASDFSEPVMVTENRSELPNDVLTFLTVDPRAE